MVSGTTLRIPGQLFAATSQPTWWDPCSYVDRLWETMNKLKITQPRLQSTIAFTPTEWPTCTHIFIRRDAVRQPLQAIYDGTFRVLRREEKVFIADHNGKEDAVSVDRLKPAFLDMETWPTNKPQMPPNPVSLDNKKAVTTIRSRRRVHWPDRYSA
ncbi:unnamed protein product [Mesocestoides corti]|uniref:Uncharacterized protein n=1 Tax=Mesocestoides corti TaxID=53468 RepID=A0A0R3UC32_MESCO|nr:unnamed protein product [Mesocestoides corti]